MTRGIAEQLARAAAGFTECLGPIQAGDLTALVAAELGHAGILDDFQPHGAARAQAFGPGTILHVISGNTPHAGLQSLLRGLLLRSHNLCKLPADGLPALEAFRAALPPELAARVEFAETLDREWLARADAVIVFGADETVETLRARVRPGQRFIAHGQRVSLGLILDDAGCASAPAAARAVSLFDQQGCLSPQGFYVRGDARGYAEALAAELGREAPGAARPVQNAARIRAWREDFAFRAANDPDRLTLWTSEGSTAWTVAFDAAAPEFALSPLSRVVTVKPLPADLPAALAAVRPWLSAIGLWPATPETAAFARDLGASRLCPLDRMQFPPLTWHQDGAPSLAALVRWVDFEPDADKPLPSKKNSCQIL